LPTGLKRYTGGVTQETVEADTVRGLIDALSAKHPALRARICDADGSLQRFVNVFVNGADVRFVEGIETPLAEGDDIQIVLAIAGGSSSSFIPQPSSPASVDWDRFARQVVLPEIGPAGQVRLGNAAVRLEGDPSITTVAYTYIAAAGMGTVTRSDAPAGVPGEATACVIDNGQLIRATAQANGASVGAQPPHPSPMAPQAMYSAAGMLLAIESIKRVLGVGTGETWSIDLHASAGS
jgi:molybdopterin converting factor small subunit